MSRPGAAAASDGQAAAGGPPRIRPARPQEADLLIELQARLARETEGLELDPTALGRGVRAVFDDPGLGEYWVAELGGKVAACLLVTREWSDWRNGTMLWIQGVYVLPEHRGRGLYRALYEQQRRRVEATPDLKGIRLYVDRRNHEARAVYARLGMTDQHYVLCEWMK
ncbi:MAG TPA: GNAT family N-acetyltransferase [Thermoanaerobaculia bacterium]|nr:GNAT family N-acetyltransferase [Thermoanaerobaculia bacterium]